MRAGKPRPYNYTESVTLESVRSFRDYVAFIADCTTNTQAVHGSRFCAWCIRRFIARFGNEYDLWDGLTEAERAQLEGIVQELQASAANAQPMSPDRALNLEALVMSLGVENNGYTDVNAHALALYSMVWCALAWAARGEEHSLAQLSEEWINALDFEQTDPAYNNDTMFTFPDLRAELERQTAFLRRA